MNYSHLIGFCGAFAILALVLVRLFAWSWNDIIRRGREFAVVFLIGAIITTLSAQKPGPTPSIEGIRLNLIRCDAKGFDVSWDYLKTDPSLLVGKRIRLRGWVYGKDYNIIFGDFPTSVTNYHCNAVSRGFPADWMANDWEVRAEIDGLVSSVRNEKNGGDK